MMSILTARPDALDVQIVTNAVLEQQEAAKGCYNSDTNRDGKINSVDIQVVVNRALLR